MIVRPAIKADHAGILALWNPIIRDTTVTFSTEEKTPRTLAAMIAERRAAGREFLIAEDAGAIVGFATYGQFRAGNGYVHAMEHTIILAPQARRRGAGRALMSAIEEHARAGGGHMLFAGVSGENTEAVRFHELIGFKTLARIPEVGRKFDRWHDLVLMVKALA